MLSNEFKTPPMKVVHSRHRIRSPAQSWLIPIMCLGKGSMFLVTTNAMFDLQAVLLMCWINQLEHEQEVSFRAFGLS
jgi:hypothetical protein